MLLTPWPSGLSIVKFLVLLCWVVVLFVLMILLGRKLVVLFSCCLIKSKFIPKKEKKEKKKDWPTLNMATKGPKFLNSTILAKKELVLCS